jgi:hypothetical protein
MGQQKAVIARESKTLSIDGNAKAKSQASGASDLPIRLLRRK